MKDVQLGSGGPPGQSAGAADGGRALTRVLRSCGTLTKAGRVALSGSINDVLNTVFPTDCQVCGGPVLALSGAQVCEACVARVGPHSAVDALCTRCGDTIHMGFESARFVAGMGFSECMMCRMAPPEFTRAVAFAAYDDEVREMLHLLKFNGMRRVADAVLAEGMANAILQLEAEAATNLVVIPVPLFSARERSRGFNQSRVLAEAGLAKLKKLRPSWPLTLLPNVLHRVKDTRSLYALAPHQRRASLRGAFRVADASAVRGREVLLIDDIMTTGATARECSRVLLRAGATKVWVATLSRAHAEGQVSRNDDVALWDATPAQLQQPNAAQQNSFLH